MSATLTRHPETHIPVPEQAPAPEKTRHWVFVAATAAVATAVGIGVAVTGTSVDDGSHQFAETRRHQALASLQTNVVSSQTVEFQRQLDLAAVDGSTRYAEVQRMTALAPVVVYGSVQHAEVLRFATIGAVRRGSAAPRSGRSSAGRRQLRHRRVPADAGLGRQLVGRGRGTPFRHEGSIRQLRIDSADLRSSTSG